MSLRNTSRLLPLVWLHAINRTYHKPSRQNYSKVTYSEYCWRDFTINFTKYSAACVRKVKNLLIAWSFPCMQTSFQSTQKRGQIQTFIVFTRISLSNFRSLSGSITSPNEAFNFSMSFLKYMINQTHMHISEGNDKYTLLNTLHTAIQKLLGCTTYINQWMKLIV